MIHFLNSISFNKALLFALGFIAIVGLGLSFQGFDVCDEGLALSVYQQVFNCPSCVEFNFYRWFAAIIGGLWYVAFPDGGIWSFRVLTVLVFLLTTYFVFKIFRGHLRPYQIALATIIAAFVSDFGLLVFYHNHLTILLYVLIVFFLQKGIVNVNYKKIAVAGFLTVFCVLSRLPNLTLLALSLTLLYPYFVDGEKQMRRRIVLKSYTYYMLGLLIGTITFLILAMALGHEGSLINSFYSVVGHGTDSDSNHNLWALLTVYFKSYINIFFSGIVYLIFGIAFLGAMNFIKHKAVQIIISVLFVGVFLFYFSGNDISKIYFLILLCNFIFLFRKNVRMSSKLLSVMGLIIVIVLPLGSDGAILNMGYASIWMGLPFATGILFKIDSIKFNSKIFGHNFLKPIFNPRRITILFFITLLAYAGQKVYKIANQAYFDGGSRLLKTYDIHSPLAQHIYTKKSKAKIVNNLLDQLEHIAKPNDYLLAYDKIPMINYLTETRPYMYTPWVWVYSGDMFEAQLKRAEENINTLPIVVVQKFETIGGFSEPFNYLDDTLDIKHRMNPKRTKAINHFIKRHNYKLYWSDSYFSIYLSNETK